MAISASEICLYSYPVTQYLKNELYSIEFYRINNSNWGHEIVCTYSL